MPCRVSLKAKIVSGACVAVLLFGAIAHSMPAFAQQDGVGNRGTHPLHTDFVTKHFTYDANGNHIGTTSTIGTERKEYDELGRLTRYEGPEGVEEYAYFGASHKRRTVNRMPAGGATPELTTFLYDGNDVVSEFTGNSGVLSKTYVTPELDEHLSMAVHNGPDLGTYYYTQNGLGSVQGLTDLSGNVRNAYDYTAFGEPYETTVAVNQPYGYTGRRVNPLSGNMDYRFRNYNPVLGRFDARDPIGYRGGINQYAYVDNMPYSYTDPFGLKLRIVGEAPFKKKVIDALNEICSGLTMDPQGNVEMNYCPVPEDELCGEWYDIIHNDKNNVIRKGTNIDPGPAGAIYDRRTGLVQSDGTFGSGSNTDIFIHDEEHYTNYWENGKFDVPATLILPWSVLLSHELGHVFLLNKGMHPDGNVDINKAEENSMRRENQAWERIKTGYQRKRY